MWVRSGEGGGAELSGLRKKSMPDEKVKSIYVYTGTVKVNFASFKMERTNKNVEFFFYRVKFVFLLIPTIS